MPTIKKIKMTGYCDHHDIAVKDDGMFTVKKHRTTDIYGTWKATEAYEIELRMSDKEVQFLLNRKPSYRDFVSTEDTIEYLRNIGLLPKVERTLVCLEVKVYVNHHIQSISYVIYHTMSYQ